MYLDYLVYRVVGHDLWGVVDDLQRKLPCTPGPNLLSVVDETIVSLGYIRQLLTESRSQITTELQKESGKPLPEPPSNN